MVRKGLTCLLFVLLIFAVTYMGLVIVYRLGTMAIIVAGIVLVLLGIGFFFVSIREDNERKRNYYGIFSGLFLWGALGEVVEKLGIIGIADWYMFPMLCGFTFLVILFGIKRYLPTGLMFSLGHFNSIWVLHFIMINQFELVGRMSWITYPSCIILFIAAIFFGFRMTNIQGLDKYAQIEYYSTHIGTYSLWGNNMAIRLVFNPKAGWTGKAKSEPITYREMHILMLSAQGYSNKEIAEALGLAYQTVKNNFYRLMKKLGAKTSAQALLLAMRSEMIKIEWISDDMDESLSLTWEQRKEIKEDLMQEIEKIEKMSKDEAEKYMAEQNLKALNIKKRRKSSK